MDGRIHLCEAGRAILGRQAMTAAYFLYHIDEQRSDGHHHGKLIGIYSTTECALRCGPASRAAVLPGSSGPVEDSPADSGSRQLGERLRQ